MSQGNGRYPSGGHQAIHAAPDFLGSHQGLQPAVHPLPRHRDRVDVARRPADRQSARHHFPDCRLRQSHPRAQRRRTAVPARHFPTGRVCDQPRSARRPGHQRNAGDERRRAKDQAMPESSGSRSRWMDRTRTPTIRSAAFPARSTPLSTACATCRSWEFRCRSTPPSRATTRTSCRPCSTWRAASAPMRCIPSCWCPWDAEWISPPSRWLLRKSTSGC